MQQQAIFFPVAAMAALTFGTGVVLLRARFRAVAAGEVSPRYFLFNRGGKLPPGLLQLEQHYRNLLELPLLFYVLAIALFVTGFATPLQVGLAWAFVGTRLVHTIIHTHGNQLRLRMLSFSAGAVLLMLGWALWVWRLVSSSPG